MRKLLVLWMVIFVVACHQEPTLTNPTTVVPKPSTIISQKGYFTFLNSTGIYISDSFQNKAAKNLIDVFLRSANFRYTMLEGESLTGVNFINKGKFKEGAYQLIITEQRIDIVTNNESGAFNAVQTLIQLLSKDIFKVDSGITEWHVPCLKIIDQSKQAKRIVRLGNQYNFIDKKRMKKIINLLALHKINGIEIEMIDKNGWKLFFKNLPFRLKRSTYYSKEDYLELKTYAADRNITLTPIINLTDEISAITLESLQCKPVLIKGDRFTHVKKECAYFLPLNKNVIIENKINFTASDYSHCNGYQSHYLDNETKVNLMVNQLLQQHQISSQKSEGLQVNPTQIHLQKYLKKIATQLW